MKKKTIIIISAIVLVIAVVVFLVLRSGEKEMVLKTEHAQKETIEISVTATGYVQPVDKVDVGTQVSGVIEKIFVDFNSHVKKGQLLAELDKSTLREKLTQMNASYSSAQGDLIYAQQNYDRTKQLYDAKAATKAVYEEAVNRLTQAKNAVANAKANVHQAEVNLSYAEVYSPIDGIVLNRAVEQGQTVASSFNTPTLFTIANDLKKMQVEANIDEADIGGVQLGQKVSFTVDSYMDDVFTGTVSQIRLQPTVVSNVVTYTVIIDAPNPDEKLFPGMTANVTIVTRTETGIAVPAEALYFSPTKEDLKYFNKNKPNENSFAEKDGTKRNVRKGDASGRISDSTHKGGEAKDIIWVKTPDGGIRHQYVKIGLTDGIHAIIEEGIKENDEVVLSASFEKKSGEDEAVKNPLIPKRPGGGGGKR